MKKILIVFGTRPEAIKMAPLVIEFKKHPEIFKTIVCVTGQHREMLDQVLNLFEIIPDYDLNLMKPDQDLYDITSGVLLGMRNVIKEVKPDMVFVHGDTSTSTAAALAAYYQQIPVAHVEAGLRTNDIYSPFPEEINRQITSRIAKYNFCPTTTSKLNLLKEGVDEDLIYITGNTVIDALLIVLNKIKTQPKLVTQIEEILLESGLPERVIQSSVLSRGKDNSFEDINNKRKLVLITGHRRENFGDGFLHICEAIRNLASYYPDVDFVYPMHLNPNVRKPIHDIFGEIMKNNNLFFIEPLEYLPFIYLMHESYIVLTDSGGIQEEAPSLGKPVVVMRNTTERPEALESGTVVLAGTDKEKIFSYVSRLLTDKTFYEQMTNVVNPYGNGYSSINIFNCISE